MVTASNCSPGSINRPPAGPELDQRGVWFEIRAFDQRHVTNVPGATSPYTNTISGGQRFFRLAQRDSPTARCFRC